MAISIRTAKSGRVYKYDYEPHPKPVFSGREWVEMNSMPEPNTGCWIWTGSVDQKGYGKTHFKYKHYRAHRLSYEAFIGDIPSDKPYLCHSCDNRLCVNPNHLVPGTHEYNMTDMVLKGRQAFGEAHGNNVYKNEEIREMRRLHLNGMMQIDIAEKFGCNQGHVGKIVRMELWKNVA